MDTPNLSDLFRDFKKAHSSSDWHKVAKVIMDIAIHPKVTETLERIARANGLQCSDGDDFVQEVRTWLLTPDGISSMSAYREWERNPEGFLSVAARNFVRKIRGRPRKGPSIVYRADIVAASSCEPEASVLSELKELLHQAIGELPGPYRDMILLVLDGRSPKQIAEVLGITSVAYRKRLSRGYERLRILLEIE
jgi:RNA polymerase sigma factor (sigma-70 family)